MTFDYEELTVKLYDTNKQEARLVDLKEYVIGAVSASMPPEFPKEALKAQAICCRTLAVKRMGIFGGSGCKRQPGFDVCSDSLHCQGFMDIDERQRAWGSRYEEFTKKIESAVEETSEIIMVYNNNPIEAVYHEACGGCTEDSENVWGNKVSYLRRVECIYCKDSPYWNITKNFSIRELKRRLAINFDENLSEKNEIIGLLDNIKSTASGRIKKIRIGDMVFNGEDVRNLLGLSSTKFTWKVSGLSFDVMGMGNGLGLCQYGARGMALLGFPVDEILKFYFTGVDLKQVEKPTYLKPLIGKTIVIDPGQGGSSGKSGPMGLSEGYVNLEIAKVAAEGFEQCGAKVILTRNKNEFVSLSERVQIANNSKPDIAISIQQNFFFDDAIGGTETFYYPGDAEGKKISEYIHRELTATLMLKDMGTKPADLYVLRETNSPSVMLNIACLSNPKEERLLSEPQFRQKAAKAIIDGIKNYYHD
ncbi:stage II sporulation protein D [Tepidanaerobacter acetatoxydans]|uniref:stage II sporulation protein D n=1 Tax=Tepidanaerobacter acetatoxydans TaxID=499229 RepID=UPI001BD6CC2C|nr:stage II sporulation protein D [Tepidanaerobacter acetatoxydans]